MELKKRVCPIKEARLWAVLCPGVAKQVFMFYHLKSKRCVNTIHM